MKRYTASRAREQFADVLSEVDRSGGVVIARGDAQYVITRKRAKPARRRRAASAIEILDPAVARGEWSWDVTDAGFRFRPRTRPRR